MLKLIYRQATILLVFSIGNNALFIDYVYYVSVLSTIREYYKASGIFILYENNLENKLETLSTLVELERCLSSRNISSQSIAFSEIQKQSDYLLSLKGHSALFVVFINSMLSYDDFAQATTGHDMSYHAWFVLFLGNETSRKCLQPTGNPFHLAFDSRMIVRCQKDEQLRKWYALRDNHTRVIELGAKWDGSLVHGNHDRMFDLRGTTLRIATPISKTSLASANMQDFFNAVLQEMCGYMNFTVVKVREAEAYGRWDPANSTWSGLIGFLMRNEVDLVVAPLTVDNHRSDYMDFSRPLLRSPNRIYIEKPRGASVQWSAYFRVFSVVSWCCIVLILIVMSLLTAYMRVTVNQSKFIRVSANFICENFIRIWGIYCQQGLSDFPADTPLRIAYVIQMLLTLVVWAIYSASITSYLTVPSPSLPFSNTRDFVKDGSYKLIVLQNSSDHNAIMEGNDPVLSSLRPLLKNVDDLPRSPAAGFLQVCKGKVGFYSSEAILKGLEKDIPCRLSAIETGQYECLSFGLTLRSPYFASFNYNLGKLEDNGVMKKLKDRYFREMKDIVPAGYSAIGIWSILPLLVIFASGFAISIFILFVEHRIRIRRRRRRAANTLDYC